MAEFGSYGKFWNRVAEVSLDDGKKKYNGFDIRFDIEKTGRYCEKFKVSILGLTQYTINELTQWNPADAYNKGRVITLSAGYSHMLGLKRIAQGRVVTAIPTSPPEMWIDFDCIFLPIAKSPLVVQNPRTMKSTVRNIFAAICCENKMGMRIEIADEDANKEVEFRIEGKSIDLVAKFVNKLGYTAAWDLETIVLAYKGGVDGLKSESKTRLQIITPSTGLISIVKSTVEGAVARVRLNDNFGLQERVQIESELMPGLNKYTYKVIKKHHVGHLRGDEWYTELTLLREFKSK